MKHLATLIDEVLIDAESHDVEVSIQYDSSNKTLGASYKDDVGTIRYLVRDTETLWTEIVKESEEGDCSPVDAFWGTMNDRYRI